MADNKQKLFYTVSEANVESFINTGASQNALGLVSNESYFGYIVSNGKQFGASYQNVTAIANVIADAKDEALQGNLETYAFNVSQSMASSAEQNAKDYADGLATNYDAAGAAATAEQNAKNYADGLGNNYASNVTNNARITVGDSVYNLVFDSNNQLTVVEYIATTVKSFGVVSTNEPADFVSKYLPNNSASKELYVGQNYNENVGISISNGTALIKARLEIDNPTANSFSYTLSCTYNPQLNTISGQSSATSYFFELGVQMQDLFVDHAAYTEAKGTVAWAKDVKYTSSLQGNSLSIEDFKFSYTVSEGENDYSGNVGISTPSATWTVKAKVPFMYGTGGTGESCTTHIADYKYGGSFTCDKLFSFEAGDHPVFAIPVCLGKDLTCKNEDGSFTIEGKLLKIGSNVDLTLNGCTTQYNIWRWDSVFTGAAKFKIVF